MTTNEMQILITRLNKKILARMLCEHEEKGKGTTTRQMLRIADAAHKEARQTAQTIMRDSQD